MNLSSIAKFVLLLLVVFIVSISPALAGAPGGPEITSFSISCTSATVTYTASNSGGYDFAEVTVENLTSGDTLASYDEASPFGETVTLNYPAQPVGSLLIITVGTFTSDSSDPVAVRCVESSGGSSAFPNVPICPDGRINEYHCEPVAIYPVMDEGSYGVEIWIVKAEDKGAGKFAFFVPAIDLDALPENPEEPILVAESKDGFVQLYKLPTGELQVNAGPDYEGKMFVFIMDDFPNTAPVVTTYMLAE